LATVTNPTDSRLIYFSGDSDDELYDI